MAPRVLGDVSRRDRQVLRHRNARRPRRLRRFDLSASRRRDRAVRSGDREAVRAFLAARRVPQRARHEDVEAVREFSHGARSARSGRGRRGGGLLFWQTHYRKALDFTDDALVAAGAGVKRLGEFYERVKRETGNPKGLPDGRGKRDGRLAELAAKFETDFRVALDDDLNAPRACAALFEFVHEGNAALDAGAPGAGVA